MKLGCYGLWKRLPIESSCVRQASLLSVAGPPRLSHRRVIDHLSLECRCAHHPSRTRLPLLIYMADRLEPPHIHVTRDDDAAKLWLDPLEFAFVEGFRRHECNEIRRITEAHLDDFRRAWFQTFGGLQP